MPAKNRQVILKRAQISILFSATCTNVSVQYNSTVGTQEIRFGRKTNEIAKFSILDEKQNSQFGRNLDEKRPTDRRTKRHP